MANKENDQSDLSCRKLENPEWAFGLPALLQTGNGLIQTTHELYQLNRF